MLKIEYRFDMPASVPYAAMQDGADTFLLINCCQTVKLPCWVQQTAVDAVTEQLDRTPPGTDAEIIDFEDLRSHRELRRAAKAVQASPRFMGSMLALAPLLVACAAPEFYII